MIITVKKYKQKIHQIIYFQSLEIHNFVFYN